MVKVAGIRETLEEFSDDQSDGPNQTPLSRESHHSTPQNFDLVLFSASSCTVDPVHVEHPSHKVFIALLDTYIYRVDSVLKVTHVPSLRSLLLSKDQDLAEPSHCPSLGALKFAICFTATCTLTELESQNIFMEEKSKTMNKFRLATEVMLSRANLLNTSDITVLQAFVIYLVCDLIYRMPALLCLSKENIYLTLRCIGWTPHLPWL